MFRTNMFFIALFTSDIGFKHFSCIVVNFGFALRCCRLVTVVMKFCGNVLFNHYGEVVFSRCRVSETDCQSQSKLCLINEQQCFPVFEVTTRKQVI